MKNNGNTRWKIIFSFLLVLITILPYCIACRHNAYWEFSGFLFGTEDGNSYIAKMLGGATGAWLFRTPYTGEAQNGFLAFLPYLLLGKLSSPGERHAQLLVLFQIFRTVGVFFYVWATYDFINHFIKEQRLVKIGVVLASIGGGVGWFSILGLENLWSNQLPLEFYSPESFGFLSIYGLPHLAFSRAFLLWGLLNYLKATSPTSSSKNVLKAGLNLFAVGFFQPLTAAVAIGLIFAHSGFLFLMESIQKRNIPAGLSAILPNIKRAGLIIILPAVWVIYNYVCFSIDPFLKVWQNQNIIKSPPIQDYILAYFLLIPFMIGGLIHILKNRHKEYYFILVWILCFPILAYAPYNLQRRLPEGIWVAIIISALVFVADKLSSRRLLVNSLLVFSILPQIIILAAGLQLACFPTVPIFRPRAEVNAFEYLAENSKPGDIVLAAYETSNAMPAWAAVKTLIGHGPESLNLDYYESKIEEFYTEDMSQSERLDFITANEVDYVFWGPFEKQIGNWDPRTVEGFYQVYDLDGYKIFSVK